MIRYENWVENHTSSIKIRWGLLLMEWNMSTNRYMRWYGGTHGVHVTYWEGMGVYGGGGCGPIVALWRRSNFLMVDGSELKKKWLWWNEQGLSNLSRFSLSITSSGTEKAHTSPPRTVHTSQRSQRHRVPIWTKVPSRSQPHARRTQTCAPFVAS